MKKNVASQKVGVQMVAAADGSAFTGSVTVEVTGDAGTQATGSVGSGACTHEGNGYHTYAPAQAETNYDLCAFTFHGTGAIPATVQIYTSFPQTGDNFARLGAPAGASVSADVAAVKVDSAAVKVQTDKLTFTVANQIDSNVLDWKSATAPAMPTNFASLSITAAGLVATTSNVKKNTAFPVFLFALTDSTTHAPKPSGASILVELSKDGGGFANSTNSAVEIAHGAYYVALTATEMNCNSLFARITATAADDQLLPVFTQP